MIGRKKETVYLTRCLESDQAEFLVLYGRRRVGKTYLIKEYFNNRFSFYATGVASTKTHEQLAYFRDSLVEYGGSSDRSCSSWREAFSILKDILSDKMIYRDPATGKRVVFLDELPWMDTPRSDFKSALDHFWNSFASAQKDLLLIVCGSATSWIIRNILADHGGFYNRVTKQIHLQPFTLSECEEYYRSRSISLGREDILESYMVFGGIPFYLSMYDRRLSLAQNIDALLFDQSGQLYYEYDRLFQSLFRNAKKHLALMKSLSKKCSGMTRVDLIADTGIADGDLLTRALEELEQSGFIRKYRNYVKKKSGFYYQIIDPFSLFCIRFLNDRKFNSWLKYIRTPSYNTWRGYAFELVCMCHIDKIKSVLGISGVESMVYAWRSKAKKGGAQIDLLIDREDHVINLCEIKYSETPFSIDADYRKNLENKLHVFADETGTKKALHLTMICAGGLEHNQHSEIVQNEICGEELF
jgi:AAA+ ATPase superfamily predicted ATPase